MTQTHLSGYFAVRALAGVLACLAICCESGNLPSADASAFDPHYGTQVQSVASLDGVVLGNLMTEGSKGRYYSDGEWYAPTPLPGCWVCLDGAGTAAAVLGGRAGSNPELFSVAKETFDHAIATEQLPDGAFQAEGGPSEIATGMELVELDITYLELHEQLDASTRAAWLRSIEQATDYLVQSGAMTWYINGNVQLRQVEDMWLAWKITGASRFQSAYESEWSFTIAPPQAQWPGFGLQVTRVPTHEDGADGAGYLAESGGGTPGFDPEYTTAQLDNATSLWVLTHDVRYLRLMNLLFNQLRPLINASDILNASEGTRKHSFLPFFSMAPAILLDSDDRPDLGEFVSVQLTLISKEYRNSAIYENLNSYRGLGVWLSMPLLYEQWPNGIAIAPPTLSEPVASAPASPVVFHEQPLGPVSANRTSTTLPSSTPSGSTPSGHIPTGRPPSRRLPHRAKRRHMKRAHQHCPVKHSCARRRGSHKSRHDAASVQQAPHRLSEGIREKGESASRRRPAHRSTRIAFPG